MFRPNLQNEDHRRAWALLQAVPEGQKSAFLVKAILDSTRQDALESTLRRILREELQAVPTSQCGSRRKPSHRRCSAFSTPSWMTGEIPQRDPQHSRYCM